MLEDENVSSEETPPTPDENQTDLDMTELDPNFIPEDSPQFEAPPVEPFMDASGPTDRDAPDFGEPPVEDEEVSDGSDA